MKHAPSAVLLIEGRVESPPPQSSAITVLSNSSRLSSFFSLPAYSVTKSRRLFIFILLLLFFFCFFWRAFLTLLLHHLLLKKQTPEHPAVTCSQTEGIRRLSFLFCFFLFSQAACVLSAKLPDCSKSSAWAPPAHLLAYDSPPPHTHTQTHTTHPHF